MGERDPVKRTGQNESSPIKAASNRTLLQSRGLGEVKRNLPENKILQLRLETVLPSTGKADSAHLKNNVKNSDLGDGGISIRDVNVSPMFLDVSDVPSWNTFGGRGATSVPGLRPVNSSSLDVGSSNTNFLPGLLNSRRVESKLHGSVFNKEARSTTNQPDRETDPFMTRRNNMPQTLSKNASLNLKLSAMRSSPKPDTPKGKMESIPAASYIQEKLDGIKLQPTHTGRPSSKGENGSYLEPTSLLEGQRVEPWAYKIIEKYHGEGSVRPLSRCSNRRQGGI